MYQQRRLDCKETDVVMSSSLSGDTALSSNASYWQRC